MEQNNAKAHVLLTRESVRVLQLALELASTQMAQCVRLLDGDTEFCYAINQVEAALNTLRLNEKITYEVMG